MTTQEKCNLMAIVVATTENVQDCTKTVINLRRLSEFIEDERSKEVVNELGKILSDIVDNCNFIAAVCKTMAIDGKSDVDSIMKTLAKIKEDTKV
jgi:Zn-dependent M16 (insulinase) family peptidase